jgi:F-type H+-transporting ATPase subunit epsilon
MDGTNLTLTVVTPESAVVEGVVCQEVTLPAEAGQIGVLPGHTPLVTLLGVGTVEYKDGTRKRSIAVKDGFAEIANDVVRVLADRAMTPEAVDPAAAARDKDAAEAWRMEVVGDEQLAAVNADVAFAEARLKVSAEK